MSCRFRTDEENVPPFVESVAKFVFFPKQERVDFLFFVKVFPRRSRKKVQRREVIFIKLHSTRSTRAATTPEDDRDKDPLTSRNCVPVLLLLLLLAGVFRKTFFFPLASSRAKLCST